MANVFSTPKKLYTRKRMFSIAEDTLRNQGWMVSRELNSGKASLRRITREHETRLVSIRTTQDTYIAFPRTTDDSDWVTLSIVDAVVAVSVDSAENPQFALVHMIDGDDMRDRFNRAYAARLAAGHSIPVGRGVWVPLYLPDESEPVSHVGGGAGLQNPPIARVRLLPEERQDGGNDAREARDDVNEAIEPITIGEAKRRLAFSLGVDVSSIKITVEA